MTILAVSLLISTGIAALLYQLFHNATFNCVNCSANSFSLILAILGAVSLIAAPTGAILLLIGKKAGLYFSAVALVIWCFLAFTVLAMFYLPMLGVPIMIAELIIGWFKVRW